MTLTVCRDLSPADWIVDSDLPWDRLVGFGPAGFDAYARLRLLPDPAHPGQSENDVDADDWRADQMPTLLQALSAHTTSSGDCYFCVWDGYGHSGDTSADRGRFYGDLGESYVDPEDVSSQPSKRSPARPGLHPASPSVPQWPQVVVPNRAYFLFHGQLVDAYDWGEAELLVGQTRLDAPEPAFVWPADRAWCVALDVDPHWAGVGADTHVIVQLVSDTRLDVVPANPTQEQPAYP